MGIEGLGGDPGERERDFVAESQDEPGVPDEQDEAEEDRLRALGYVPPVPYVVPVDCAPPPPIVVDGGGIC